MTLELQPITYQEACTFIERHHRHHIPPQGWKFGIAANDGLKVVGVITIGRPVTRHLDDGWTLEITRCCTDGTKNVATVLMGAAWRAVQSLGYRRIVTYTLQSELGTSLKAAGFTQPTFIKGKTWDTPNRKRVDKHSTVDKWRWEKIVKGGVPDTPRIRIPTEQNEYQTVLVLSTYKGHV